MLQYKNKTVTAIFFCQRSLTKTSLWRDPPSKKYLLKLLFSCWSAIARLQNLISAALTILAEPLPFQGVIKDLQEIPLASVLIRKSVELGELSIQAEIGMKDKPFTGIMHACMQMFVDGNVDMGRKWRRKGF